MYYIYMVSARNPNESGYLLILWLKSYHEFFFFPPTVGRQVFTSFLRSEFSEENMDFWVACEEYRKMAPSDLAARAQQIYQQYIESDAPKEVIPLNK